MRRWRLWANVGFAAAVLAIGGFGLRAVALRQWRGQPTFQVRAQFSTVAGVEPGHRVRFQGIDAGVVQRVTPPSRPGEPVELSLRIDERLRPLVRTDTVAAIIAEGMIGSKVVELRPGAADAPAVADNGLIASESPLDLAELTRRAGDSLREFDQTAQTAREALQQAAAIAADVREGKGSLGKLVRDDSVYDNLVALTRRGEKSVAAMEDDLMALKQTWPISRYFESRAYLERDRALYHPGARRVSRSYRSEDLFEPGGAVLTPTGKTRLDEAARWFQEAKQAATEVVVAAFAEDEPDPERAEALTQEQAETVRAYLVDQHGVNSNGWFKKKRKVAAVGFGDRPPRLVDDDQTDPNAPPRRVEIFLFTPQA